MVQPPSLAAARSNRTGSPSAASTDGSYSVLLRQAGVGDARLHDARHTAATMLVLKVPTPAVMAIMGWSEAAMAKRYRHSDAQLIVSIADEVGGAFWTAGQAPDDEDDDGAAGALVPA